MVALWTPENLTVMRRSLLDWYQRAGRTLPWRNESDIYRVWISEIMLQQTQVKTVIPYYERWLAQFPTVEALAAADLQAVLKQWEGLGYYARARNLHQAAQQVVTDFAGQFPEDLDKILRLKGIGRTTAGGILSSARNLPLAILDGNVKRVLARLIALEVPPAKALDELWDVSETLLDPENPRDFNQALMDLGATLCTVKTPACPRCPWQNHCTAYLKHQPTDFPRKAPKKQIPTKKIVAAIAFNLENQVFIQQRPQDGLLGGLWEFPNQEGNIQPLLTDLFPGAQYERSLNTVFHAYTHFKIQVEPQIYRVNLSGSGWVSLQSLKDYPFSKAHLKIIEQLQDPQLSLPI
ncbi:A/G-specific adenine glycosylase [Picosynechococcus sp. PCC 11901]|uniref:A/G-specific adenine glycosylase n=1 Tax=Picosynechococcus sp. PCC 11901 TaxID=2579791 RepID=UPI0010FC153B|nr:A/G-specific adenine glycosylase [Picosynechococcus sp. PCC 11901]QCS50811.1 A/G-specific adenine glycosylase [Picosynechococcus sp. PCC 11901]